MPFAPLTMRDFSPEILAYALQNALEFGSAEQGKILPKLFQHGLDKKEIKDVMPLIAEFVKRVNKMDMKQRESMFASAKQHLPAERADEKKGLPELPHTSKQMVFRMAPFPSGALHIGNAKTYLLNALYAEKYGATLLLVIDDTIGSEEKKPIKEGYELIEEAVDLLGVQYKKPIIYKSDRLEIYYEYAQKLIEKGNAYVCHCSQEKLRTNRAQALECECRQFPPKIQLERWEDMFDEPEGQAVLRIKTSMQHPNPAFRDRVLFRISDREHPRVKKKYRIWPTLEMTWAIDDHLLGITHILRGNDLMIETDMEKFIWDIFGWKHPVTIHTGLITIEGMGAKISKSKAQKEVQEGMFTGWDDPRTWSVQSLMRRGITKEAIRAFVEEIGLNKQDITVPIEALYAHNRRVIDARTSRFYFVKNPTRVTLADTLQMREVIVPVHPDTPENTRTIAVDEVYISQDDHEQYKGKEIRLLHLCNLILKEPAKITSYENKKLPRLQWVSKHLPARILQPDGNWIEGAAEDAVKDLEEGSVIQFERVGFVRYDGKKGRVYGFWFAHP